jgi:hypothetical protein
VTSQEEALGGVRGSGECQSTEQRKQNSKREKEVASLWPSRLVLLVFYHCRLLREDS